MNRLGRALAIVRHCCLSKYKREGGPLLCMRASKKADVGLCRASSAQGAAANSFFSLWIALTWHLEGT